MATSDAAAHTNRLADETSPYLLQHAHNPVDWYPWGNEALARARDEQKPIFLSIGYAACHWCHVMERESFEDEQTARVLNESFVPVKVDREERPDLDSIYMDAVQQMTGHGGWPMSVFLTPDGKPFYGGTYFPDQPRHGLPSFRQVLDGVSEAWRERRAEVEQAGAAVARSIDVQLASGAAMPGAPGSAPGARWTDAMFENALLGLERSFDAANGGWGRAPKFPQPMTIEFLLRHHLRTGDARPLAMARRSLDAMAAGGIYDHLGGGFARYATDAVWLVPHFEKMLYDNAQLARAYVHAWQLTKDPGYRAVAEQTLEFMRRELLTDDGGFAASLDADTDGEEGATYVWSLAEIERELGSDAELFARAYGVTVEGNWEGHNILSRVAPALSAEEEERLRAGRDRLLAARQLRPQPARDDKVLAAWNGLAIAAFADAAVAFAQPELAVTGARAAELLLTRMRDESGRLYRSWKDGRARHSGVLEDYADLCDGLLALYEATFDERWFTAARELADAIIKRFADPAGGFFDTAIDHEELITRPKGLQDNALPSGGAMATQVLLRLAALTGHGGYRAAAESALNQVADLAHRYPAAFAHWLAAATFATADVVEIAISGAPVAEGTRALLSVVRETYRPFSVVALGDSASSAVPLLRDRPTRGDRAAAYVCRNFACRAPVTEPDELQATLASRA